MLINELLSLAKQANKHFSLSLKAKRYALPVSWATWLCNQGRSELCSWVSSFGSRAQQALSGLRSQLGGCMESPRLREEVCFEGVCFATRMHLAGSRGAFGGSAS